MVSTQLFWEGAFTGGAGRPTAHPIRRCAGSRCPPSGMLSESPVVKRTCSRRFACRSFIGECGLINHFSRGCKRLFLQIHYLFPFLSESPSVKWFSLIHLETGSISLPSNTVHKEGLDRSLILSFSGSFSE